MRQLLMKGSFLKGMSPFAFKKIDVSKNNEIEIVWYSLSQRWKTERFIFTFFEARWQQICNFNKSN